MLQCFVCDEPFEVYRYGDANCPRCGARHVYDEGHMLPAGEVRKAIGKATAGLRERVEAALDLAVRYGGVDGDHHKAWVIDQMVRALAGDNYERLVAEACAGEDGPQTYSWDVGVAP